MAQMMKININKKNINKVEDMLNLIDKYSLHDVTKINIDIEELNLDELDEVFTTINLYNFNKQFNKKKDNGEL